MKRFGALAALAVLTLAACGPSDDGSPTAEENALLDSISKENDIDASPDSLTTEDAALGNGESAETGDVLVAEEGNSAGLNVQ